MNSNEKPPQMEWLYGGSPNYIKQVLYKCYMNAKSLPISWMFGEPDITQQENPGNTCAYIPGDQVGSNPNWQTSRCYTERLYICQV